VLLAIDVGNTNIVPGVFDGSRLVHSWRLATLRERTADEIGIVLTQLFAREKLDPSAVDAVIVASVVPPLTPSLVTMSERYFGVAPLVVDQTVFTGMPIRYENPAEVGADRIVNGVAAFEEFGRPGGCAVIVVDFGTATTFDAISAAGEYLGGVICPGIQISADALFQRAARLPRIEVRKPANIIGRTTVASMQAGLFFGYVDMVEGLVGRIRRELGGPVMCVATGGLAEVISPETTVIQRVSPDLTLNGLRIIWDRQRL
jgi:type III pantothenate kinase